MATSRRPGCSITGSILAFADAGPVIDNVADVAKRLLVVGVCSYAVLFILCVILARLATRPVEQAWEHQRRFIADASHELKTPLTVILANSEILEAHDDTPAQERARWLHGIQEEAERMKALVHDMLELAQTEENDAVPESVMGTVDLSDLAERGALAFDAVAFEHGCTIESNVEPHLEIQGDDVRLERLIKILIDNAVKYADTGSTVLVTLGRNRRRKIVLQVHNEGVPIDPDDLPHVFDRFWRASSSRSDNQGQSHGLGLAIAKGIVEAHRGRISVTSSAEKGTTFTVVFS